MELLMWLSCIPKYSLLLVSTLTMNAVNLLKRKISKLVLTDIYRRLHWQEEKHSNFMHRLIFNAVHSLQPSELLFNISLNFSTSWQMQNNQWLSINLFHQGLNMLRELGGWLFMAKVHRKPPDFQNSSPKKIFWCIKWWEVIWKKNPNQINP